MTKLGENHSPEVPTSISGRSGGEIRQEKQELPTPTLRKTPPSKKWRAERRTEKRNEIATEKVRRAEKRNERGTEKSEERKRRSTEERKSLTTVREKFNRRMEKISSQATKKIQLHVY